MLDRHAARLLQPVLSAAARQLARRGIGANTLTLTGAALGLFAAFFIAIESYSTGLSLLFASRLMDGLDGAVARQTQATDAGGFLDIALDFLFYAAIPLAFALADPPRNALPAAVLLAAFVGSGTSFLAFAVLAAKRGLTRSDVPGKSFYFLGGLTEATETLICFAAMCLWPAWFPQLALGFATLCGLTWITRIHAGWRALR
ncbi:MAG: CDP-alcohol phosphatidyltransferase family protein [Rhodoferax sp.]|nr:CDP-alcohol phosphatidyltransferase family protein [Rhodoferax sp.]